MRAVQLNGGVCEVGGHGGEVRLVSVDVAPLAAGCSRHDAYASRWYGTPAQARALAAALSHAADEAEGLEHGSGGYGCPDVRTSTHRHDGAQP